MEQRVILLHGFEGDALAHAVRAIKAALPESASIAFASTTETNVAWKVGDLIEHVSEEHAAWARRSKPKS